MPETRYAKTRDGAHVAYQVLGDGPLDLMSFGYGNVVSIDSRDGEPHFRHFEHRLASFSRLIRSDPRGVGLSDPPPPGWSPSLGDWVDDSMAVLDAAGSPRAAVYASANSGMAAMVAAGTYPQRVSALVLIHCYARLAWADDYPWGFPQEAIDQFIDRMMDPSGDAPGAVADPELVAPSLASDPDYQRWWTRAGRQGASPASARGLLRAGGRGDVRAVLSSISAPTLVLHRVGNRFVPIEHSRYLAERIPGARLVTLSGRDHMPHAGDSDALVDEIEEFLTGVRPPPDPDRILATVLLTDIVGSTERAAVLGDRAWRQLLDYHDAMTRRQLVRFGGREVKATGDGFVGTFDGPGRAVRCAQALRDGARQLGLEVRVGVHTGEIERRGDDIGGIGVHIAARVTEVAQPAEVLTSRTVVDLVAGSGIRFTDRGKHQLKGVPTVWRLYAVVD